MSLTVIPLSQLLPVGHLLSHVGCGTSPNEVADHLRAPICVNACVCMCVSVCVCSGIWVTLVSLPNSTGASWVWTRHCFQQDGVTTEAPLRQNREDQVWPCHHVQILQVIFKEFLAFVHHQN